jgi:hypothetical protein
MKQSGSSFIAVLLMTLGLLAAMPGPTAAAENHGLQLAAATVADSPTATTAPAPAPAPGKKSGNLVDANSVFFGCAVGVTVGALVTALPPLVGWTFYAGALPAVMAMIVSSGVGCTVGLFGGVIVSAFTWVFDRIGAAWSAVFG